MTDSAEPTPAPADSPPADSRPRKSGILQDALFFLREYRFWWLTPILAVLILMVIVALLAGPARTPFIYRQ